LDIYDRRAYETIIVVDILLASTLNLILSNCLFPENVYDLDNTLHYNTIH